MEEVEIQERIKFVSLSGKLKKMSESLMKDKSVKFFLKINFEDHVCILSFHLL